MTLLLLLGAVSCSSNDREKEEKPVKITEESKIISLNGTVTEILFELGVGDKIIGTDVTSTYPESAKKLPKLGHSRNLSVEGVFSMKPNIILGLGNDLSPKTVEQLKASSVPVFLFNQEHSVDGTAELIREVAIAVKKENQAEKLISKLKKQVDHLQKVDGNPSVLFIYARGAGTLMVAGDNTQMAQMIEMVGAQNAISGFDDFKPLTSEALLKANPDYILLFESGIQSLNGADGLLEVPGVSQTTAGKNKAFISMDGQLLSGFGPRLGEALQILAQKLN